MKVYSFLFLALLAACGNYNPHLQEVAIPTTWKQTMPSQDSFSEKNRFWELFEDPILNELEEEGIAANFDLQIAASRIFQSRATVLKEHGNRFPQVSSSFSAASDETLLNPHSFGSSHHMGRVKQEQYSLLAGFSYELDLWGKLKAKEKSARYRLQASELEYEFVYQTLVTDIATHYFTLRTLDEEIAFLERAISIWAETVHLNQCRVQAGLDPAIDLSRSKLELARVEAEIERVRRDRALEENALATLIGKPASSWKISTGHLPKQIPNFPSVLPSEILLRRADIQRASAQVAAGRSDVEVALKSYFPSFPLTASLGLVSPFLSHLFEWQARYWSYALNAIQPLFDGWKRKADVHLAKARFAENFAEYQKTVNQAFKDVEDALSTLHHTHLQIEAQTRAVKASTDTLTMAQDQFQSGLISYLLVADSENTSIQVGREAIALKGQQIIAWIRLMKSLGIQKTEKEPSCSLCLE